MNDHWRELHVYDLNYITCILTYGTILGGGGGNILCVQISPNSDCSRQNNSQGF